MLPNEQSGFRLIDPQDINTLVGWLRGPQAFVSPNDNGASQTLTVGMVSQNGSPEVYHRSTGGTTPTLTLPSASAIIANLPDAVVNSSWYVRFINNNSGTATIAVGAGITSSGTLTLATNTWRDFVFTVTGVGANAAISIASVGTGTDS
jgi:hypothetical protein